MPKGLRLKKTPAEEAERDMRRARRAAKKAANRQYRAHDADFHSDGRSSKRSRTMGDEDVDLNSGAGPSTLHYGARTVPAEESFQEKLWDALGDDDRLDGIEARLNEYAYVPRRWRGVSPQTYSPEATGGVDDDPNFMNDDEYAEWVRVGIWRYVRFDVSSTEKLTRNTFDRKRNAATLREQERQKAAHAAAKAEAERILRAEEDARRRARHERGHRRRADARDAYQRRWAGLLESKSKFADLGFGDIPWPVPGGPPDISLITAEAVSAFLFFPEEAGKGKTRKEELRGTMLRFHPDKFEGRIIPRVREEERAAVREGANAVTRAVSTLMEQRGDIT